MFRYIPIVRQSIPIVRQSEKGFFQFLTRMSFFFFSESPCSSKEQRLLRKFTRSDNHDVSDLSRRNKFLPGFEIKQGSFNKCVGYLCES